MDQITMCMRKVSLIVVNLQGIITKSDVVLSSTEHFNVFQVIVFVVSHRSH